MSKPGNREYLTTVQGLGISSVPYSEPAKHFIVSPFKQAEAAGMREEEGYEHGIVSLASQLASKPDCP